MKPPKCRNCGKEEWRHICGGIPAVKQTVTKFIGNIVTAKKAAPGRPKVHGSDADRQRACRDRKKVKA